MARSTHLSKRDLALERIRIEVAQEGKAGRDAIRAFVEHRISAKAFREAIEKGLEQRARMKSGLGSPPEEHAARAADAEEQVRLASQLAREEASRGNCAEALEMLRSAAFAEGQMAAERKGADLVGSGRGMADVHREVHGAVEAVRGCLWKRRDLKGRRR